jgi:hypothetical protein
LLKELPPDDLRLMKHSMHKRPITTACVDFATRGYGGQAIQTDYVQSKAGPGF